MSFGLTNYQHNATGRLTRKTDAKGQRKELQNYNGVACQYNKNGNTIQKNANIISLDKCDQV